MAKDRKNLLTYHLHDQALLHFARIHLKGKLIDIGCGTKPYKSLLKGFVTSHMGLDRESPFNANAEVDLVGTAYEIPCEDNAFDSALSTAALEHLAEPELALRECIRVLKPGGIAIYTVPFIWHVHAEPWDYYRFTHFGLDHLFKKVGFEVIEIKPLSGFWVTFGQLFVYYLYRFNTGFLRWSRLVEVMGLATQGIAYSLEKIDRAEQWTWMYIVVAKKPAEEPAKLAGEPA